MVQTREAERNAPHPEPRPDRADTPTDFIREAIKEDLRSGRFDRVHTRFPPEPNAYLHIGHAEGGLDRLRHRAGLRRPVQPALRRHEPAARGAGVRGRHHRGRPLARRRLGRPALLRVGLLRADVRVGGRPDPQRQGLRVRPVGGGGQRHPRHAHQPGHGQPVPEPERGGEPGPLRPHAGRRVSRWRADAAREDRHGLAEHDAARPGDVPHHPRRTSPPGRQVVHLPDVRLGARPGGFHRGRHALALLAGIRDPPPALRLVPG